MQVCTSEILAPLAKPMHWQLGTQELTCFHGVIQGYIVVLHELHKGMLSQERRQADMPGRCSHVSWGERRLRLGAMRQGRSVRAAHQQEHHAGFAGIGSCPVQGCAAPGVLKRGEEL